VRRRLIAPAVLLAVTLVVVSCSDSSGEDSAAEPTVASTSPTASPSTEAAAATTTTTSTTSAPDASTCDPVDPDTCSLRQLADHAGILLGAAVAVGPLADDPTYGEVLAEGFNSVTPESAFKWPSTEPEPGVFTWESADAIAAFAADHDLGVRGHTLVWPNSQSAQLYEILPSYVTEAPDAATMQQAVDDHIAAVVDRFGDVTDRWDVINEPLVTAEGAVDPNVLTETLGEHWMVRAFQQARELDPEAKLYVNEVLNERPGSKHDGLLALVQRLIDAGAPIDGVGLQGHFLAGTPTRDELETVMGDWDALGIDVAITELDIPTVAGDQEAQAAQYADVVGACLAVDACVEVTLWGLTDRHTWLNDFLGPGSAPLLFDEDYEPKPAYDAVAAVLADAR
jgi:endo-1,4-beta-xylanase